MFRTLTLFVTLLPLCHCIFGIGRMQSIAVKGKVVCHNAPASNVTVKLYEEEIFFDTKLDQSRTDSDGKFRLSGSKREITNIDPKVNIYHKCGYKGLCIKRLKIYIPDKYITKGSHPDETYDAGTLHLDKKVKGQKTVCK
ncbi:Transthyretin-like family protein [Cooperia oncophora]